METNDVIEFDGPDLEDLSNHVCREHGFHPVSFRFVAYGIAPERREGDQTA